MVKRINDALPQEVKQLRLGSAFRGYAAKVKDCIETSSDEKILIVDDEYTHVSNLPEDEPRACVVLNPDDHKIVVLSIDHKLVKQHKDGMADGAAFDLNKFCFLEFKDQAQGNSKAQIEETYDKAMSQLHEAIELFVKKTKDVGIDMLSTIDVEAHIIVHNNFPREKNMEQDKMLLFPVTNHETPLSFEKIITF